MGRYGEGIHFLDEHFLRFGALVAVDGGLDFVEVLDYVFETVCG